MQCGTLFSFEYSDNLCRKIKAPVYLTPRLYPISRYCSTSEKESGDIGLSICHYPLCWSITKCWQAYSIPTLTNWKGGYSAKECIKWSSSILPWSRVINMNRPNMEFPEFPSEKSRSKAGAWVRKGLVLSDRKRKLSIQIQKHNTSKKPATKKCSGIFSPVPTERGDLDRKYLDRLLHLPLSSSPQSWHIGTPGAKALWRWWYTWCTLVHLLPKLLWLVHLCRIATLTP